MLSVGLQGGSTPKPEEQFSGLMGAATVFFEVKIVLRLRAE